MYFFVYLCICLILPVFGWIVYHSTKRSFSIFFFIFTLTFSLWLILYFLFFGDFFQSQQIYLYLSRINFLLGLFGVYNVLFFVHYYGHDYIPWKKILVLFTSTLSILGYIYIFTDCIIPGLVFDKKADTYREVVGICYSLTTVLYLLFLVLLTWIGWKKMKTMSNLDKVRLGRVLLSIYILMTIGIFLQLILPLYNIHIFEKEFIFFPVIFVVYTYFTLRKYYFNPIGASNGIIFSFLISLLLGIGASGISIFIGFQGIHIGTYWQFHDPYYLSNMFIGILVFFISHEFMGRYIFNYSVIDGYKEKIFLLEKKIAEIYDFYTLNEVLKKNIAKIFHIQSCDLKIISLGQFPESRFREYFESKHSDNIFINDIVFIEQHKDKYPYVEVLQKELDNTDAYIIFPLLEQENECIGYMVLGKKNLQDYYSQQEIEVLRGFSYFLSGHIRYIFTYHKLQDFSKNLDKKVDEKTIEYNDLINKQKEFISTISHEIKSPIAGAILQVDSIMDDISDTQISRENIHDELEILNVQLVKVGDLLSKLFSVQYYDTRSVSLFKERIQIQNMLNMELDIYERIHEGVHFTRKIDPKMGFIHIDKIQFQQVLTNLLNNAIKFSQSKIPEIHIEAFVREKNFHFSIEDNGEGFSGIDISTIFEKYAIGSSGSVGLGIGLYLCKRIVEMHNGTISASIGSYLHGARIDIIIPI